MTLTLEIVFVHNFSAITKNYHFSDEFIIGERKWSLLLYPKGDARVKRGSFSLYLKVADSPKLPLNWKLYATIKQHEKEVSSWFSASMNIWGFSNFICSSDLNDKSKGFIMYNTLIVEVEILVMSVIKKFT
ncbi:hypothetical protein F0562_020791 [Nyssa sinensis]|uniref:MATH domain-containing protein n=1 Tax=Nyssa sinensis TaxID=561372 RepID=A0A5J5BSD5_9ASTE|nr:hypothetical protein F0562_020791 [Nyssa sinensis]